MSYDERPEIQLLIKNRRARQLAYAIIQRAKDAGIPREFLRVDEETFGNVLCHNYHGDVKSIANYIYNDANFIQKKFIVIDGGPAMPTNRKTAGCAILFLLLANDKRGNYSDCVGLGHKLYSTAATSEISRNDLVEEYKSYDVLFLSEVDRSKFNPHFESGAFFDEILNYRSDNDKTTIISFCNPIGDRDGKNQEQLAAEGKLGLLCGKFLTALSFESKSDKDILRIRVKTT